MPEVMLRKNDKGQINFYIAKKDMEEIITSLEFDSPDKWGGKVILADDSEYYIEPLDTPPKLPITLRVKRL
ncbi:MAG: putative nitrogen fixation protein NifT [Thiotrichaceae bacterium]